ncbi:dimethyl sulfoxide reductase [Photobacterium profundum]|uniref:Anaerobic dimethyl sulfoxide reductase chain A n=1 Tax=Photobacterium profundum 3TCK TaxID=314280 RepID=Q1ZA48_9GAMM|nr:DMSO/selenate family reductase complex A subunit [Photobacterium profundum]EAS45644.1 anaerobic dimethyl sulfoxide reductase chain A [Photobacterium profundum 3TCK]PSV63199.1 dimethyl sulfoxide reductase [Photobacterium profundum]
MNTKFKDKNTVLENPKRRSLLKLGAFFGASAFLSTQPLNAIASVIIKTHYEEITKWHNCWAHCHSSCLLIVVTENGRIKRIETDDQGDDEYGQQQVRACLRGRAIHKRTFSPDRLKYPMRRIGKRGEGKFERISWDEALNEVHKRLSSVIDKHGNSSIFFRIGYGKPNAPYHFVPRFLNSIGGHLPAHGNYSSYQIDTASAVTYGDKKFTMGSAPTEFRNSDLILYFGNNPANTRMSGGSDTYNYQVNKRVKTPRTIIIDPQYTDTACGREDQWIPIHPGTDAALVEALAYILITENYVDEEFLATYCYGYDKEEGNVEKNILPLDASLGYKAYILGHGADCTAKTPERAEKICGIQAKAIYTLARELGNAKAPFIAQGWGPQRQANGEQTVRSIYMLPMLLGQVGLPGTSNGGSDYLFKSTDITKMPLGENNVKAKLPCFKWLEAIERGQEMTSKTDGIKGVDKLDSDVKCIFVYQGNWLINQHSDCNGTAKIIKDEENVEFIFVMDNFMTASAKFADILLPDITWLENSRIVKFSTHLTKTEHVLDPMYECRHPYDVFSELAGKFGVRKQYTEGRSWDEWQQHLYELSRKKHPEFPPFEVLDKAKTIRMPFDPNADRYVFKDFRKAPEKHPLPTSTGKIEIYSHILEKYAKEWTLPEGDVITPLPSYVATWEGFEDFELKKKYPLQLIGCKPKGRAHSVYQNVPWLREVLEDAVIINPVDAKERNISNGDIVHIYNDRGTVELSVRVTPRVMPGVVVIPEGMWFTPNAQGIDKGGCINTLTKCRATALAKANPQNTNLVEIKKS